MCQFNSEKAGGSRLTVTSLQAGGISAMLIPKGWERNEMAS